MTPARAGLRFILIGALSLIAGAPAPCAQQVLLRFSPPTEPIEYNAQFSLDGSVRVAPAAALARPYVGETRLRGSGSARFYLEPQSDAAPLALFLRSAQALVEAFDSRLEVSLAPDNGAAALTMSVNRTPVSSLRLEPSNPPAPNNGAAPSPQTVTVMPGGLVRLPICAAAQALPAAARQVLSGLVKGFADLPATALAQGDTWTQSLLVPAPAGQQNQPLVAAEVRHRLEAVDLPAGTARVSWEAALSPAPGRSQFRVQVPVGEGGSGLALTVTLEQARGEASGWLLLPLQPGAPIAASQSVQVLLRARVGSDDADWQGRQVIVEAQASLTCDLRRSE